MKQNLLSLDDDYFDFCVSGISSELQTDYRFIYKFNHLFCSEFVRIQDLDFFYKNEQYCFSCFEWMNPNTNSSYYILKNLSNSVEKSSISLNDLFSKQIYLLPELKHYQYILKSFDSDDENPILKLSLAQEKSSIQIRTIQLENIHSKENLIF